MKKLGLVILLLIYFPFISNLAAQNISNEGIDFWTTFPTHDPSENNRGIQYANIRIYVTSKTTSEVVVSCGSYTSGLTAIPANEAVPFDIPRTDAYISEVQSNAVLSQKGIHIVVTPGKPKVAVYAHIYAGARSAASLILPTESLGQKYYSMNYTQDAAQGGINRNFLTLIATEDNTSLLLHRNNGVVIKIALAKAGEVYQYMPGNTEDLTGTFVEIDPASADNCSKRFAAFSGSTSLTIGCSNSRDPLFQQLYPTTSWGKNYGIVPFKDRTYYIRIIAQEDNTKVQFNGNTIVIAKAGDYYQDNQILTQSLFVTADKKISVAQYSLTQDCTSAIGGDLYGDPEMVMLNPIEFNIKSVTLFSSDRENIIERYINVCMKTSAISSFKINGSAPSNGTWSIIPSKPEYSSIQININEISSTLTASDGFNAIAYGFGDHESYAYSAGTNLAANNYLLISNKTTKIDAQNACLNQASDFKIVLSYKAIKIIWTLDDLAGVEYTPVPQEVPTANGLTYVYLYDKNITFDSIKQHKMVVSAEMPNLDNCLGADVEYEFTFDVYPIPTPKFGAADDACTYAEVIFTESSESNITSRLINKWQWDFGDGEISTEQNPRHIYKNSGSFTIKFSAGLDDGCMSDVIEKLITIKPKITAKFSVSPTGCVNTEVVFLNQSTVEPGATIDTWLWNFGDGETSAEEHPKHKYILDKVYEVTLVTGTDNGCLSLPQKIQVTINKLPLADFVLPEACLKDDAVTFKNLSANTGGGASGLTYLWNFGDPASGAGNTSTQTDGSHKYSSAKLYQVSLTTINPNGCINTITKDFTVNGGKITPALLVMNKSNLCSNREVLVQNNSKVDFGKITRVIFYIDALNKPTEAIVDEDPEEGETYPFLYPAFTTTADQHFTIRMVVFSGTKCFEEISESIVVKSAPIVIFGSIPPICINGGKITINQARETIGIQGTGRYDGPGILADGTFDPAVAGTGNHTLTYTFTATNRCDESKTQTITVYPIPSVTLTRDIYVFIGGQKKMEVSASGSNLTYKWTPSAGLDRDDIPEPLITADDDRVYTLTIQSDQGCSITEKVYLHVLKAIVAPSAFSPNGDGVNDQWVIKYLETYPDASVSVFSRSGERVFYSHGYITPFDGNYKNQPLPVGTYYYIIDPKGGRKTVSGPLTILR
ncbi:PKD domain-containing protein [Pedobacter metabolipauper]|uniref:Gliding motility-associated-like protein n=1 Tax=Pedobacter metabolipauper TaxID=425513 RepID=A0A4R6SSS3_9SPHI|nr:PKD domain-containing protein [Pedobacter metabolipauper]TDQ06468.1 gliding motility-associated-like protein [Pedobacter metabolipauper]